MNEKIAQEFLDALLPSFESLETQSSAILQFLKDKGIASDKDLAPYLDQAGKASNVRWRAVRIRMERLLASLANPPEEIVQKTTEKEPGKPTEDKAETDPQKDNNTVAVANVEHATGDKEEVDIADAKKDVASSTPKGQDKSKPDASRPNEKADDNNAA
jgi:hypothetical protein